MTIAIIGAGYVGLTSAAVLAKLGHTVYAVRKDADKVEMLRRGEVPFYEPGLSELVKEGVASGKLIPTLSYAEAVPPSEVVFICVGTPPLHSGEADLSQVFSAAKEIAENWGSGYKVIADKSTVPVGTAGKVRKVIEDQLKMSLRGASQTSDAAISHGEEIATLPSVARDDEIVVFDVASCPEFLREGSAVHDTMNPDRVVIGIDADRARDMLLRVHEGLPGGRLVTDIFTPELI